MDEYQTRRFNEQIKREARAQAAWKAKYGQFPDFLFPEKPPAAARLRRLRAELARLEEERFPDQTSRQGALKELRSLMVEMMADLGENRT